jgi:hypothetical protein
LQAEGCDPYHRRHAIIDRTAGSLTREEADELERIIAEGCEQLDEHD